MKQIWLVCVILLSKTAISTTDLLDIVPDPIEIITNPIGSVVTPISETIDIIQDTAFKALLRSVIRVFDIVFADVGQDDFLPEDVKLFYYNNEDPTKALAEIPMNDLALFDAVFDTTKQTVYYAHNWMGNKDSEDAKSIKEAILRKTDVNYITIEWPANVSFVYAARHCVPKYGKLFGQFINEISTRYNYDNSNVTVIGYGLGGQFAGVAGYSARGTLGNIVTLDPSGPLFNSEDMPESGRLSRDDAQYVQVIHTNAGEMGTDRSVGDADFWVNGGTDQPACESIEETIACSHGMSVDYYVQSINYEPFVSIQCNFDENCQMNFDKSSTALMGGFLLDHKASGDYYVKTDTNVPYNLGTSWIDSINDN